MNDGDVDVEKKYHIPDEFFPAESFELAAALQKLRDSRDSAVPANIAAKLDQATAELVGADALDGMPGIGDMAPKFELANQNGSMVSLDGLLATGPVVVVFYRGVWSPACNLTLRAYEQHVPQLRKMRASLVAISLQTPDASLTMAERNALSFEVLSDVGADVSYAYGLVFELPGYLHDIYRNLGHPLPAFNGTDDWELLIPASFVIGRDGRIQFADAIPDYLHRTDPADVIAVVRQLTR
jgi:peroxiredoxin